MSENAKTPSPVEQPAIDTASPEFAAAVAAQAQAIADAAIAKIAASMAGLPAAPVASVGGAEAQAMFRQMALAIAEISDQGTNRKRVAPEILAARDEAHSRMVEAILRHKKVFDEALAGAANDRERAEAKKMRPRYRAVIKLYLNERLVEPFAVDPSTKKPKAVEFQWNGVPNEGMRPENAAAREIYGHYLDSIGSVVSEAQKTPIWLTAGGLSIIGQGPQRRQIASVANFDDDLDVDNNNPNSEFVNVLGTVQAPARRNSAEAQGF